MTQDCSQLLIQSINKYPDALSTYVFPGTLGESISASEISYSLWNDRSLAVAILGLHKKKMESVKRRFLKSVIKELGLSAEVLGNVKDEELASDIIICRAFKKLDQVIQVSREIAKKPHKLMILKGQNAQKEIKNSFKTKKYPYKLENSMTNKDSRIILMEINK